MLASFILLFFIMHATKKWLLAALLLVATIVLIFFVWVSSINPLNARQELSARLSEISQQKSTISGTLSWQAFPSPGILVTDIQIGEDNPKSPYSLHINKLFLQLKLVPLLRGKLVFNELTVDGFQLQANAPSFADNHSPPLNPLGEQFAIERFLLSHGKVTFSSNQKTLTLSGLQIGGGQFNLSQRPFPIQLKTQVEIKEAEKRVIKTQLNFKGSSKFSNRLINNPLMALQNASIEGELVLQKSTFYPLKINKINAHLKTGRGLLSLNPLTLTLYKGESIGKLDYAFASKKLSINQMATNLDSSALLYDLFKKHLTKGSMDFSIHSEINTDDLHGLEHFSGQGSVTIKEGSLEAIDLNKVIEDTNQKINHLSTQTKTENPLELASFENQAFAKGSTPFNLLTFHYLLQNGTLESQSLVLQTDTLQLKGSGRLYLNNTALESHLFAKLTIQNSAMDKLQQLLGGSFPLIITGTLSEPKVVPDLHKINPLLATLWVKDTLTKPVKLLEKTVTSILTPKSP
jgi:uncharacterized protein involved in outer membrane biogenesis